VIRGGLARPRGDGPEPELSVLAPAWARAHGFSRALGIAASFTD
jgi:hypothetical protein